MSNGRKIIFLDFTGTIDVFTPWKSTKLITPRVVKYEPKTVVQRGKFAKFKENDFYSEVGSGYYGYGDDYEAFPYDPFEKKGKSGGGFLSGLKAKLNSYKDEPTTECVKLLEKLIKMTGAKIVYSSTRRYSGWKTCAKYVGLPLSYSLGGAFGVTPEIDTTPWFGKDDDEFDFKNEGKTIMVDSHNVVLGYKERQKEIAEWFKVYKGPKVQNYVILDDDPITDKALVKHWVPSIRDNGFKDDEFKKAVKILMGSKK